MGTGVTEFSLSGESRLFSAGLAGQAFPDRSSIGGREDLTDRGGPFAVDGGGPGLAARAFDGRGVRAFAGEESSGVFPGGRSYGTEFQGRSISFLISVGLGGAPSGPHISN